MAKVCHGHPIVNNPMYDGVCQPGLEVEFAPTDPNIVSSNPRTRRTALLWDKIDESLNSY